MINEPVVDVTELETDGYIATVHNDYNSEGETTVSNDSQKTVNPKQIVVCKECEFGCDIAVKDGLIRCVTGRYHAPNWYCADGIKRNSGQLKSIS